MNILVPTKRVGSKVRLAPWIVRHLPPHETYIEVFGGTGAVLFSKLKSPREVYNDLDSDLHNLFRVIRERPHDLARVLALTAYSRREYEETCEYLAGKQGLTDNPVEWARRFVVYTRQSFIGGGGDTWSTTRAGHLPSRTWLKLPEEVQKLHGRLQGVSIENLDYPKLLTKWDAESATFYIDPPYVGVEHDYYEANKEGFDHQALREAVELVRGSVVISYYRSDYILKLYNGFRVVEKPVTTKIGDVARQDTEILLIRPSSWAEQQRRRPRVMDIFPDAHTQASQRWSS